MRHTIYNIGMAAVLLAATAFCTCCTREMQGQKPEIILETVSEGIISATFSISAPGASALSYVQMPDKPDIPSAKAIIAGGLSVPPSGKTITLDGLLSGHSYGIAAAAVSEDGIFSEVKTLVIKTAGNNCTFDVSVKGCSSSQISYKVVPSDGNVTYAVAAIDAGRSADADDAAIYRLFLEKIKEMAGSMPLQEYLERAGHTGTGEGLLDGLEEGTDYLLVVSGISGNGEQTTLAATAEARTIAGKNLDFDLSYSELTASSVHLYIHPSDKNATFVWACTSTDDMGNGTDNPDRIAEEYVRQHGETLEHGFNICKGDFDINGYKVRPDTGYRLFAFGYAPGIGITGPCSMVTFRSEWGYTAETFEAEITPAAVTSRRITAIITPVTGCENVSYMTECCLAREYDKTAVMDNARGKIEEQFEQIVQGNPSYTMADAVNDICYKGERQIELSGLEEGTEYTVCVIPVSDTGTPADVISITVTTLSGSISDIVLTADLIGYYDGKEVDDAGLFPGEKKAGKAVVAYRLTASDNGTEYRYNLLVGDYTDPEESGKTDDDLLAWTNWKDIDISASPYLIETVRYFDDEIPYDYTLLTVAKDASGTYGKISRQKLKVLSTETSPVEELEEILSSL